MILKNNECKNTVNKLINSSCLFSYDAMWIKVIYRSQCYSNSTIQMCTNTKYHYVRKWAHTNNKYTNVRHLWMSPKFCCVFDRRPSFRHRALYHSVVSLSAPRRSIAVINSGYVIDAHWRDQYGDNWSDCQLHLLVE